MCTKENGETYEYSSTEIVQNHAEPCLKAIHQGLLAHLPAPLPRSRKRISQAIPHGIVPCRVSPRSKPIYARSAKQRNWSECDCTLRLSHLCFLGSTSRRLVPFPSVNPLWFSSRSHPITSIFRDGEPAVQRLLLQPMAAAYPARQRPSATTRGCAFPGNARERGPMNDRIRTRGAEGRKGLQ